MGTKSNSHNLIITGVGGQGNVLSSKLIGQVFLKKGYHVTIGETYGSSQRGGAVMSHIRISPKMQPSPLIPKGKAHVVLALEPVEAVRVLIPYGNKEVVSIVNTRPFYPVDVNAGEAVYPEMEEIEQTIRELSDRAYFFDSTAKALEIGPVILVNMIMLGALIELRLLPVTPDEFFDILDENFKSSALATNVLAVNEGRKMVKRLVA